MRKVSVDKLKNQVVKAIIENSIGSIRKPGWTPYTYNYGHLIDFINPIDEENWDIIIPEERFKKSQEVEVRIIGIITQEEGDDNLIGIPSDKEVDEEELRRIEREIIEKGYRNTKLILFI